MPLQLLLQVLLPPTALIHTTPHACLNLLVPVHTALLSHLLVLVHTNPCAHLNPLVPVHTPHTPLAPPHTYSYHPRAHSNPGTHPYLPHTLMRPHIAYTHNEPCATLCDTFATIWGDSCSRTTKDDKGRHALRPFAMSYTILQYSTVLPFTFATFSNLF